MAAIRVWGHIWGIMPHWEQYALNFLYHYLLFTFFSSILLVQRTLIKINLPEIILELHYHIFAHQGLEERVEQLK